MQTKDNKGRPYDLEIKAGKTFELLARNPLEERTLASCTPADRALHLRSEENLFKVAR